jgi:lysozyme family protein
MATFEPAIQNTLVWEGGYANNPHDSGGETYRGIARNKWPAWDGWTQVDSYKSQPNFPHNLDSDSNLLASVIQFYRINFWKYDAIEQQNVADKIFDLAVNVGSGHAHKIAQIAAGVTADGVLGPNTINAINAHPNGSLLPLIVIAAENYHRAIVNTHPEDAAFLRGWLRRDDAIES